ncbi:YtxH domain-containing protein [Dokdonia ponticola]|uniref:YtxH domain-containing protein n=1 Tax=Dokdonia ponticola TaxID=2041041 RepID=A0ABV9HZC3_9FLAO
MNNSVVGALAGIAVGTILGVLIAPDKGSNTRKKIVEKGKDTSDSFKEEINSFLETVSEKYDVIKKAGTEIAETSKSELTKVKKDFAS